MNKKDNYILLIIICVILVCILILLFLNSNSKEETILNEEPKYKSVSDYSDFYTVSSCAYKYITYLSSNKVYDLINILDEEFVSNNNINTNNIYNYVNKLGGNNTFKAKKMYYQVYNKNIDRYYVYGYLIEETIDGISNKQDYYLIVNLDSKNKLFSVLPYDGKLFKEAE